ncbi:MAG: hypothetical protein WBE76_13705 [Terracidiphilus sp.]
MPEQSCETSDLARGWSAVLLWGVPVIALVVGSHYHRARLVLWIPALLVMGVACLRNAARCGRVHCYVTGPLSLLAAVYVALSGFHLVPMQPGIFLDIILAVAALACLAEIPFGKYRRTVLRRIDL